MTKGELRAIMRKKREGLTQKEVETASMSVCQSIIALKEYREARRILVYSAHKNEIDISGVAHDALKHGKQVFLPRITEEGSFDAVVAGRAMRKNKYGIPEPERGEPIDPRTLDMIITPLVAFDGRMNRLGQGGGFYDRYLPLAVNAVKVGVAYAFQKVKSLPVSEYDVPLDMIIYREEE